jgi:hypothetical protein
MVFVMKILAGRVGLWLAVLAAEGVAVPASASIVIDKGFIAVQSSTATGVPPDTSGATGPDHIVEIVQSSLAIFNRTTGAKLSEVPLSTFFAAVKTSDCNDETVVAYDELAGRFVVGSLDIPERCGFQPEDSTHLLFAVSDSSDPMAGFSEMHSIDLVEMATGDCPGQLVGADFNRLGWNADAYIFTVNMLNFPETCFDHVAIVAIDKSKALDRDPDTISFFHHDLDATHATSAPGAMHDAVSGDPMWLVAETRGGNRTTLRVTKMTNILTNTAIFNDSDIDIAAYGMPPAALQAGSSTPINTLDNRILSVEWRGGRLVAAHNVGVGGLAQARWYEFDVSGNAPLLAQQGTITPGAGVHTYFPSIAIAANGDLALTYMQSSAAEFPSMYVTGQLASEPLGTMQKGVLAKAGTGPLAGDCGDSCRAGDYSAITVDPNFGNRFCAVNEYAPDDGVNVWGTWVACFSLTEDTAGGNLAVTAIAAPKSIKKGGGTLPVIVTIQNHGSANETIPNASFLGDGVSTGLVRLAVDVVDKDNEGCEPATAILNSAKNAALFKKGPKSLPPGGTVAVNFLVTYRCSAAHQRNKLTPDAGDYAHRATVYRDVLDGLADGHSGDDTCPMSVRPVAAIRKAQASNCGNAIVSDVVP